MAELSVTLIDVGWGDSIFIESKDDHGDYHFGLIDSNDKTYNPAYVFLKKHFERRKKKLPQDKPIFDWIMLSHAHEDHGNGLKWIMQQFGTQHFFYPKAHSWGGLKHLLRYVQRYHVNVLHHQSIDNTKIMPSLGNVNLDVLWPIYGNTPDTNENNNSIVLRMALNNVSFVLTGDAEEQVWQQIGTQIPQNTMFFKVPHHGSENGTFHGLATPWFTHCPDPSRLGISCHLVPFNHPHPNVLNLFKSKHKQYFRTDEHYHVTFKTNGAPNNINVKYSRI